MQASVAADMTAILARAQGMPDQHRHREAPPDKVRSLLVQAPDKKPGLRVFVPAILSLVVATGGAGAWLVARHPPSPPAVAIPRSLPERPTSTIDRAALPPRALVEAAADVPPKTAGKDKVRQRVSEHQTAAASSRKAQDRTPALPRQKAAERPMQDTATVDCAQSRREDRSWCLRPAMLDADRRLRRAYLAALAAGAGSSVISRYQRRWTKVRREADDAPEYVIDEYNALAEELEGLSTGR